MLKHPKLLQTSYAESPLASPKAQPESSAHVLKWEQICSKMTLEEESEGSAAASAADCGGGEL